MEKSSEFELEELVEELEGFSHCRLDVYYDIVDMMPGALEKLKSMDSDYDKLNYYHELSEIYEKLEEFKEGKEIPN